MDYKAPPPMTKEEIYGFMKEMKIARLCSFNKNNTIHSVPVWYYLEDENIIIFAPEKSQKAVNMKRNNQVTVVIENQEASTKGVIVYGEVDVGTVGTDEEALTLFRRYLEEEKAQRYLINSKKLCNWIKHTIKPIKFASFDYLRDEVYRKTMIGE